MKNVVMLRVDLSGTYRPLSEHSLVASVDINAPPTNVGPVFFRGQDGRDVPWHPSEWHFFSRVDLSEIFVKGSPGDVVTVVGGT